MQSYPPDRWAREALRSLARARQRRGAGLMPRGRGLRGALLAAVSFLGCLWGLSVFGYILTNL